MSTANEVKSVSAQLVV